MRAKQLSFLPPIVLKHGGSEREGKRKVARPFDPKRPLHLTLKASRARGEWSLLHPKRAARVEKLAYAIAKKRQIKVYRYVNVGNHLHFILQAKEKKAFQAFLRELAGVLAVMVTGAKKGNPVPFWDKLAWSRVVNWGRDLKGAYRYIVQNMFEAEGWLTSAMKKAGVRVVSLQFDPPPEVFGPFHRVP